MDYFTPNKTNRVNELRCQSCHRKLGEIQGTYHLSIKCPKCKAYNHFKH
ncbi:Com family DNA-binding transcriptional regulator [Kingella negevensis]|nr:Com family DNA-binding transcriptional regulator [Kingella negevensis]WII92443.1 Com family DNA-binding transcriptional regulator [Kingella negevensis]